ncbi:MAG: hypothetical protein ACRDRV_08970 [Pseudonocardiaceae bacterium]
MERNERNAPELHPEETVDQLEATALDTEAPGSTELTAGAEESEDSTDNAEPAFDQDLDVEDLPGQPGQGSSSATEPPG